MGGGQGDGLRGGSRGGFGGKCLSGAPAAQTGRVFPLAPADGGLGVDIQRWDSWLGREGGGVEGRSPEVCVLCRRSKCPWSFSFSPERKGRSPRVSCGRCPGCSAASTLTQMKCLYPTPPNQAKTLILEEEQKCLPPPQIHTNTRKVAHKSSLSEGIAVDLEAWAEGEGQLLEEPVLRRGQGGVGGGLSAVSCSPLYWPPAPHECPGSPGTSGRTPGCLKLSQPFSGARPLAPPLGVCTDSGGESLQARCTE